MTAMLASSHLDSSPPSRLLLRSTLRPTSSRTRRALQILMMMTTGTCRQATTRRASASESPHDAPPSRRPLPDPPRCWGCMLLRSPHRPRRSARLSRRRRVHLFRLPDLTRARTSRCARVRATPAAVATWAPTPRPRRSCISRRTALPLLSGHPIRTPALASPHLPPSWNASGNTPRPPQ